MIKKTLAWRTSFIVTGIPGYPYPGMVGDMYFEPSDNIWPPTVAALYLLEIHIRDIIEARQGVTPDQVLITAVLPVHDYAENIPVFIRVNLDVIGEVKTEIDKIVETQGSLEPLIKELKLRRDRL